MILLPDNVAPLAERGWRVVHRDGDRHSAFPTSLLPGEPVLTVRLRPDLDWTDDEGDEDPSAVLIDDAVAELDAAWLPLWDAYYESRLAAFGGAS